MIHTQAQKLSRSAQIYTFLLLLYPFFYLRNHKEEMLQDFKNLEQDIHSPYLLWQFVLNDFIKSLSLQYMQFIKRSRLAQIVIGLVIILGILAIFQVIALNKAHRTLSNYATFRGCTSLSNQTATSADCMLNSKQTIKLVEINNKWYLDGDGPGLW